MGAGIFYGAVTWLKSHSKAPVEIAETVSVVAEVAEKVQPPEVHAAFVSEPTRASVISAFDGQTTGVVNKVPGEKSDDYHMLVYLPGLDPASETYAVWLLKDGLADVKRMGELKARADGSWVLDFTADPIHGISTPSAYKTVVIMKEPKGSGATPTGTKMADATF